MKLVLLLTFFFLGVSYAADSHRFLIGLRSEKIREVCFKRNIFIFYSFFNSFFNF